MLLIVTAWMLREERRPETRPDDITQVSATIEANAPTRVGPSPALGDVMRRPHAVARKIVAGVGAWLALGVWAMAGSPAVVGRVQGLVRDAAGQALSDTSILAVGQSVVSVRSDATGRFALSLPPGEY